MSWTDEREAEFRELYAEGLAHREIAARMGLTRNASIGKARRLGLKPRIVRKPKPAPWVRLGISERTWQRRQQKFKETGVGRIAAKYRGEKMAEESVEISPEVVNGPLTIIELEAHHCRWPVEVPGEPMLYCGEPKASGRSYCARHCRMAYHTPPRTRPVVYFSNAGGRVAMR